MEGITLYENCLSKLKGFTEVPNNCSCVVHGTQCEPIFWSQCVTYLLNTFID